MKTLICIGLAVAGSLAAQDDHLFFFQQAVPPPTAAVKGTVRFVSGQMVGGDVKASPYSAESVIETTQTLADGNRIVNREVTKLFRDSEGRERREMSLGPNAKEQVIMISDPVAGVSYSLRPGDKTAEKMPRAQFTISTAGPGVGWSTGGEFVHESTSATLAVKRLEVVTYGPGAKAAGNEENLGARTIEGVMAQGTRVRNTIPAGQIGNEKPIETTTETWYSPDLKMTVLSETSDPRMGKTVMKLTNINRSEPPRPLFEVPADYTVLQGGGAEINKAIENLKIRKLEAERETQRR